MRATLILLTPCFAAVLSAQAPSQPSIDSAIARGTKNKSCTIVTKHIKPLGRATGFDVTVEGPLNRIECSAGATAKKYLQFSAADLPVLIGDGRVVIEAVPLAPVLASDGWRRTPEATHLVLFAGKGGDGVEPVQPDSTELFTTDFKNAVGGEWKLVGVRAWFSVERLPAGEFTIVVVTKEIEYKSKVAKDERSWVR